MRRAVVRALGYLCALTVLAIGALAVYVGRTWDRSYDLPLPEVRISTDPAVLARGEYLVYGPAHCVECHSGSYEALTQLAEGKKVPLSGGLRFNAGPLGYLFSKNLTPIRTRASAGTPTARLPA